MPCPGSARTKAPALAVIAGVAVGGIVGLFNGLAITQLRVVPFIATLGMLGVARGLAKFFANQQTVNPHATWLNELAVTFPPRPWMPYHELLTGPTRRR